MLFFKLCDEYVESLELSSKDPNICSGFAMGEGLVISIKMIYIQQITKQIYKALVKYAATTEGSR